MSGPDTTAVFEDDLAFGSGTDLNLVAGGNVVVLNQHSFVLSGNLGIKLSYAHPSLVTVSGDVGIGQGTTDLTLSFDSDVLHSLKHGDAFELIHYGGDIGNVSAAGLTPDLTTVPLFGDIELSPGNPGPPLQTINGLVPHIVYGDFPGDALNLSYSIRVSTSSSWTCAGWSYPVAQFRPISMVTALSTSLDFAIWKAHDGMTSGASVLDGDADGDGDVDGADFLKWQRNVGKPGPPWPGAGSGSGSALAGVPEPTSLMLLACGGSLALAFGRRRSKR